MMSGAPTASAARRAPSITRWGRVAISVRSFRLSGSPSAPLASTTARPCARSATARHLRATGNPAPPRPSRLAASSPAISRPPATRGNGPTGPLSRLAIGGDRPPGGGRTPPPPPGDRGQHAADAGDVDPHHPGEAAVGSGADAVDDG